MQEIFVAEEGDDQNGEFKFETVGERLKAARQSKGMELSDVAAKTRVPQRHLAAIENSDYSSLPGRTYVFGFAKLFANAVDVSPSRVAADLHEEMGETVGHRASNAGHFEMGDPDKIPSGRLVWIAALTGLVLVVAGFGIWRSFFFPGVDEGMVRIAEMDDTGDATGVATSAQGATGTGTAGTGAAVPQVDDAGGADVGGEVIFTSTENDIWVKFYDGNGDQLLQKQMARGESYTVPRGANNPQIWTGRPDAFQITVGGRSIPALGTAESAIKDVPVSARALLSRPATGSTAAPSARPVSVGGGN